MSDNTPLPQQLLENQLCFSVYKAAHAFAQAYKPHLDPLGLTYPQYLVLLLLWEQDNQSVKQLGERLSLDSGTLTPLLKRMEHHGWLDRTRDKEDERVLRVTLSDKGRALREPALAIPEAMLCASGLDVTQLASLRDQIKAVSASLRKAD